MAGTNEPDGDSDSLKVSVELLLVDDEAEAVKVMVWVTRAVLVDSDGMTGDPSVEDVEPVPFLGRLL